MKEEQVNDVQYFIHFQDYTSALGVLRLPENVEAADAQWQYLMGVCHYHSNSEDSAWVYFAKANSSGSTENDLLFYLADLLHKKNDFDSAHILYKNYSQNTKYKPNKHLPKLDVIAKRIKECENGAQFKAQAKDIPIQNLGVVINSEYPDYAPVISADEQTLLFTSRRPNSTGGLVDARDNWSLEDIYICVKDSNNNWTSPEQMPGYINTRGHDANVGLSPDGQKLFIYRDDEYGEGLSGDIYVSDWKYNRWSTPEIMVDPVNSKYWETGISITPDEKTLYFTSNRPGGYGGLDIYKVQLLPNGEWAIPLNLGPTINTQYDDESPFIHPDGKTLYFSSEGHSSMGGFDIFMSQKNDTGAWSEPENMGYPLNTAQNELYFVLSADARRGYFSGIREETYGDKDLYIAELPARPVQIILLKGKVIDAETKKPLATLIKVYDNNTKELVYVLNSNAVNGRFSSILPPHRNYNIQLDVQQEGYQPYTENINIEDQKEFVEIDKTFELSRELVIGEVTILPNIFFQLDVDELDTTSDLEIELLTARMLKNPALHLELAVHTFSKDSSQANFLASQSRANDLKAELVERGIEEERLFPVGYGNKFPLDEEKNPWQDDRITPNDRTESIVIDPDIGRDPLKDGYYYRNNIEPFEPVWDDMQLDGSDTLANVVATVLDTTKAQEDPKAIIAANAKNFDRIPDSLLLHFEFDKIYYRFEPESVFEFLIEFMKIHMEVKIQITGYTDNSGHPDYNLLLSQFRAERVKRNLIERGISADRIVAIGKGVEDPRYDNSTREGRKLNRRVEFTEIFPK